ncbi:aldo/keto reductase [Galbitalea soli]|uniref:Aldo/keto reductase n=1 Tax=Galbitalea soli TaxID=1268042 RepID=A0A7C9TQ05_9MICO|nr:aldo/keto reductase [Galbitalea soli]NYJ29784.1 aryl-alcohol dehydrogenase-like predicted oxidoreductase [Galbitalea soli]
MSEVEEDTLIYRNNLPGQPISAISIGSWQTFERIPFRDTVEIIAAAFDSGINLIDTARYGGAPDHVDTDALSYPIPAGSPHCEVIVGRALQESGRDRSEYLISDKVWFDSYPETTLAQQVDDSLLCLDTSYLDMVCVQMLPQGVGPVDVVRQMAALASSGRVLHWGFVNWSLEQVRDAVDLCLEEDLEPPRFTELKYSVIRRLPVESGSYATALAELGVAVHAANCLEGGFLTGRWSSASEVSKHRMPPEDRARIREAFTPKIADFNAVATGVGVSPATLALAFTLTNESLLSSLVGVTRMSQLRDALAAESLLGELGAEAIRAMLEPFASDGLPVEP